MLLSKSVALSILATLGVNALVIPSVGDVVDVFAAEGKQLVAADKNGEGKDVASAASAKEMDVKLVDEKKQSTLFSTEAVREIIPHKYIIVLKNDLTAEQIQYHQEWVALQHVNSLASIQDDPSHSFFTATKELNPTSSSVDVGGIVDSFSIENLLSGYSGYFLESTIDMIRRNPLVAFVEKDSKVYASEFDTQKGAPWGLARVSHRQPLSLNSFNQYLYDTEGGDGVTSYIIDTGVNINHEEFGGRAKWGATIPTGDSDVDGNGHGTHCAGTIGSKAYGVAKNANLVAVKVLRSNGSGSMSDVVKGVEFAAKAHQAEAKKGAKGFKGSTANMSLGGGKSPALDLAVNAAVKAGIHFAVAAGNENQDACNTSPASAENAITVGASTISDARAYFSNYGKCVDIFAPGLNILSTYIGSDTATATLSGTSMASPHIAGLLSYYLSLQPGADSEFFVSSKGVSPEQLKKNLIHYATKDALSDIPDDTVNLLAFNGAGKNLTEFWGVSEQSISTENKQLIDFTKLENKIEGLIHKAEADSEGFFKDLENFVEGVYKSN
ncbi:hypothetical protein HYPBUDRAFT_152233 [Hyphopichia burtonii NRRL Y-1933]|uniref:Uncharacterized protein n=1 Tax=Hyphopichia burtonii NRRL Y-1933 TaxID=984485 RepID=A0A1E4RP17_9ASCO|nr:hypothetical protein HYPBUDRAFT_152233 [Hyphopichia burtonii NRRL Y-1933]ODV69007.1 hypothetical protein HYPBUDRAFT_152233 [Hyphopichia burtonii NRRL Y-1933]